MNPLQIIPGVGPSIAKDLNEIGIFHVSDLRGKHPETLYETMCNTQGVRLDRCMLYVLRCAVYVASHDIHDPELLKWWKWKDRF